MNKVIYILYNPYNAPSAAYNRIILFKKGFIGSGIQAKVDLLSPSSRFPNPLNKVFILLNSIRYYIKYFLNSNNIIIIYGENYLWHLIPFYRKAKVIVERNEFPDYLIVKGTNATDSNLLFLNKCDGFITCSNALKNYYSSYLDIKQNICLSPVIVDISGFDMILKRDKYIAYCGDWGNHKDGVDILIRAFAIFKRIFPEYKLRLIGGSTKDVEDGLHELAYNLGIEKDTVFVGRIPHERMPYYLCSSSILALARPNNKQAEGGFPSKVAEYLATGLPVVLTDVGELHTVLKDGVNCYMAKPDSPDLFAEKLIQAASDPHSSEVGRMGKETAKQYNFDIQSQVVINYLQTL